MTHSPAVQQILDTYPEYKLLLELKQHGLAAEELLRQLPQFAVSHRRGMNGLVQGTQKVIDRLEYAAIQAEFDARLVTPEYAGILDPAIRARRTALLARNVERS